MNRFLFARIAPVAACAALLGTASTASASQPFRVCSSDGLCGHAQAVDEALLGTIVGRYTVAGQVVGMNLQMLSSWQAANGQKLEGKAGLSIALGHGGTPRVSVSAAASGADAPDLPTALPASAGSISGGAGLQTVDGAVQLVQIAGDGNSAINRTQIGVGTTPLPALAANGASQASYLAANGASASAAITGSGMALRLQMPGMGVVQQQFNPNVQQAIQFAGNGQQVLNQLQLQLQMQSPTRAALASAGVGQALNMLRGK